MSSLGRPYKPQEEIEYEININFMKTFIFAAIIVFGVMIVNRLNEIINLLQK